jgi:hypothetical protein
MVVLGVIEEYHQNQDGQDEAGDEVRHNAGRLRFWHLGQLSYFNRHWHSRRLSYRS